MIKLSETKILNAVSTSHSQEQRETTIQEAIRMRANGLAIRHTITRVLGPDLEAMGREFIRIGQLDGHDHI